MTQREDALMVIKDPVAELDARFSSKDATPTRWTEARELLEDSEVFWLSTVRPDGRPHVTPLLSLWVDGAQYFCTGPSEQKAKNLERNPHCVLTTGRDSLDEGLDVVLEGDAVPLKDEPKLKRIADAYFAKYGSDWRFQVRDGAFLGEGGPALVFEVAPSTVFAFRRGAYSQTRWRFDHR